MCSQIQIFINEKYCEPRVIIPESSFQIFNFLLLKVREWPKFIRTRGRAERTRGHDFFWSSLTRGHDFCWPNLTRGHDFFWLNFTRGHDFFLTKFYPGSRLFLTKFYPGSWLFPTKFYPESWHFLTKLYPGSWLFLDRISSGVMVFFDKTLHESWLHQFVWDNIFKCPKWTGKFQVKFVILV